jgi:hypothetical protein
MNLKIGKAKRSPVSEFERLISKAAELRETIEGLTKKRADIKAKLDAGAPQPPDQRELRRKMAEAYKADDGKLYDELLAQLVEQERAHDEAVQAYLAAEGKLHREFRSAEQLIIDLRAELVPIAEQAHELVGQIVAAEVAPLDLEITELALRLAGVHAERQAAQFYALNAKIENITRISADLTIGLPDPRLVLPSQPAPDGPAARLEALTKRLRDSGILHELFERRDQAHGAPSFGYGGNAPAATKV